MINRRILLGTFATIPLIGLTVEKRRWEVTPVISELDSNLGFFEVHFKDNVWRTLKYNSNNKSLIEFNNLLSTYSDQKLDESFARWDNGELIAEWWYRNASNNNSMIILKRV